MADPTRPRWPAMKIFADFSIEIGSVKREISKINLERH